MDDDFDNLVDDLLEAAEIAKAKTRKWLMEKTPEKRFKVLREDFSLYGLNEVCSWAIPEEDYEIVLLLKK